MRGVIVMVIVQERGLNSCKVTWVMNQYAAIVV